MDIKKWTIFILVLHAMIVSWFILSGGNPQRPDSERYFLLADKICHNAPYESPAERYRTGYFSSNDAVDESYSGKQNLKPNAPEIFRTPGYPAFLCALDKVGLDTGYEIVTAQLCLLYLCIFCFYFMAKRLYGAQIANPASMALLVSPGGLVYSITLYSEVLFLFFLLVAVLAFLIYLKESPKRFLILSGLFFAAAFYVRAGVVYIPFLLSILTLVFLRQRFRVKAAHMLLFIALFVVSISPWIIRNYSHYGKFYISAQLSNTLAIWHLPDVWRGTRGESPRASRVIVRAEIDKIIEQHERTNQAYVDNVEFFNIQQQYALDNLLKDFPAYVKEWGVGMWRTVRGGYLPRLYYLFSGSPLFPSSQTATSDDHESFVSRLFTTIAQQPSETLMKVFILIEKIIWIGAIALALVPVIMGVIRFDVSAWVILAVVSYFIFIPGTMGYSRFRFAVDWLIILQAIIGANLLYSRYVSAYQNPKVI